MMRPSSIVLWCLATMAAMGPADAAEGPAGEYELHEWGVFPIARNAEWAMIDLRAEWATFPEFFYRIWPDKRLPWHGGVDKPVIFFHGNAGLKIDLSIKFSDGRPLVWWPAATSPAGGIPNQPRDTLKFSVTLDDGQGSQRAKLAGRVRDHPNEVPQDHWVNALRKVDCSHLYTWGSHSGKGSTVDQEKFVYYDGIMKAPAAPRVTRRDGGLTLETENDFDLLDVLVIDRSLDGKQFSVGRAFIDKIPAGKQTTAVEMSAIAEGAHGKKQDEVLLELQKRLVAAGLNADEAASLINVWRPGLIGNKGLVVLYRVPQETYEKWLPLTARPAPKKTVRVGLVLHAHLEPELEAHVDALIKKLAAEDFVTRTAARDALVAIGGAAFPTLEKNVNNSDAETARLCREIMKALDTRDALKPPAANEKEW